MYILHRFIRRGGLTLIGVFAVVAVVGGLIVVPPTDPAQAQTTGQPIDPSRTISWDPTGVPGGIPNRTAICSSLGISGQASTFVQNVTTAQINSAIANCPSNQVVFLN